MKVLQTTLVLFTLVCLIQSENLVSESNTMYQSGNFETFDNTYYQYCHFKCGNNILCLNICMNKNNEVNTVSIIVGVVIGVLALVVVICIFSYRNAFMCLPCHEFKRIKEYFNVVDPGEMTEQRFSQVSDKIIQNLIDSKNGNYYYEAEKNKKNRITATVKVLKRNKFLIELKLKGKDHLSKWEAKGFILCANKGEVLFWLYKNYSNKTKSGQIGAFQHLVHFSKHIDQEGNIDGKWMYWNREENCGNWKLNKYEKEPTKESGKSESLQSIEKRFTQIIKDNIKDHSTQVLSSQNSQNRNSTI